MNNQQEQFDPNAEGFWETFEKADLDRKIATFLVILNSGKMDAGLAFDMLEEIVNALPEGADQHARYADLIAQIREKAPDAYNKERKYFHRSLISFAIEDDKWDEIPLLLDVYRHETDVDLTYQVVHQMTYYGLEKLILPVMADALPDIKSSPDLFAWAGEEFAAEMARLMLWDYLATSPTPAFNDPILLSETAPYIHWKEGWLERFVPRFAAKSPSAWTPEDFFISLGNEQLQTNLHNLLAEFVADQWQAGVPYGRGDMAWQQIAIAVVKQSGIDGKRKASGKKQKKKKGENLKEHISLVPTFATLNKSLADLFPFLGAQPFHFAATVELLPAYLRFLGRLNLITEDEKSKALHDLRPLTNNIPQMLAYYGADRHCVANVLSAWDKPA